MLALLETDEDVFVFAEFAADQPKDGKRFRNAVPWNGAIAGTPGNRDPTACAPLLCALSFALVLI